MAFSFQEAIALGFEKELARFGHEDCYFFSLPRELEAKREYMARFLKNIGMKPTIPEGGYFMIADWSPLGWQLTVSLSIFFSKT